MDMDTIRFEYPSEEDWAWITEQHVETAWASLPPERQQRVSIQTVQDCIVAQIAELREKHGVTNQVFIARNSHGQSAGFVWVDQIRSGFTGFVQAYILDLFVTEMYRSQGLGRRLMAQAEDWAREHNLTSIGLSVAKHNIAALGLYEKLGYKTETLRLCKRLGER
jgi:ribosomal protein S18 acetylase RimI-like enzyme